MQRVFVKTAKEESFQVALFS